MFITHNSASADDARMRKGYQSEKDVDGGT